MRFSMPCPHCGARSIARALEKLSDTQWLVDFQCDNVRCGHTCRTGIEMIPPVLPIPKRPRRETLPLFGESPDGRAVDVIGDASSPGMMKGE